MSQVYFLYLYLHNGWFVFVLRARARARPMCALPVWRVPVGQGECPVWAAHWTYAFTYGVCPLGKVNVPYGPPIRHVRSPYGPPIGHMHFPVGIPVGHAPSPYGPPIGHMHSRMDRPLDICISRVQDAELRRITESAPAAAGIALPAPGDASLDVIARLQVRAWRYAFRMWPYAYPDACPCAIARLRERRLHGDMRFRIRTYAYA